MDDEESSTKRGHVGLDIVRVGLIYSVTRHSSRHSVYITSIGVQSIRRNRGRYTSVQYQRLPGTCTTEQIDLGQEEKLKVLTFG